MDTSHPPLPPAELETRLAGLPSEPPQEAAQTPEPEPEPCRDCGGRGYTSFNLHDGGGCPRCGGAGVEGGYAALRGG